jgi:hypothetical protein
MSTATAALLAAFACACGPRTLVVVDPDPCLDGGTGPSCPNPCADGGIVNQVPGCVPPGLLDDLVGWWRLDDSAGSPVARDLSGSGNDGTLMDLEPATAWVPGRSAGGLAVDAVGFVNVVRSPSIDSITTRLTLSGWGYLAADTIADEYATIASREEAGTIDQHYHIGFYRDRVPTAFVKTAAGTSIRRGPAPVTARTWVALATTYDGSVVRFYVDGQEVMSEPLTGSFIADTTPVLLGGNGNGPAMGITERFAGRIDEIMLYRRALSAGEIAQLHAGVLLDAPRPDQDGGARD